MTGGTASGYAGQPSRHVSGSDLTKENTRDAMDTRDKDRGYGSFASGDATNLEGSKTLAGQSAILAKGWGRMGCGRQDARRGVTSKMPLKALVKK